MPSEDSTRDVTVERWFPDGLVEGPARTPLDPGELRRLVLTLPADEGARAAEICIECFVRPGARGFLVSALDNRLTCELSGGGLVVYTRGPG